MSLFFCCVGKVWSKTVDQSYKYFYILAIINKPVLSLKKDFINKILRRNNLILEFQGNFYLEVESAGQALYVVPPLVVECFIGLAPY